MGTIVQHENVHARGWGVADVHVPWEWIFFGAARRPRGARRVSLAPTLKKSSPNGLDETPEAFGPFKPEAELTNGRGAMVGLVSLLVVEHFTKGALFGFF